MKRKVLITGITGQDGSYLADLLLEKDYQVHGMVRQPILEKFDRVEHIRDKLHLVQGDLTDQSSLDDAIKSIQPDEIYNLAAHSFVPTSRDRPTLTAEVTAMGANRLLEAIRKYKPDARFYQASSSEMFGRAQESPQNESTPFYPRSPYGVSKVYAHYITLSYRENYNLFAVSGILFNHESPRRGMEFVTRKISDGVARIKLGLAKEIRLGNLETMRDWGFAGEYIEAMWLMLQQDTPKDYVIATGKSHSVKDLVEAAFGSVGLRWKDYVTIDPAFIRPAEVNCLVGDASKARANLRWEAKTSLEELIKMMVNADLDRLKQDIRHRFNK